MAEQYIYNEADLNIIDIAKIEPNRSSVWDDYIEKVSKHFALQYDREIMLNLLINNSNILDNEQYFKEMLSNNKQPLEFHGKLADTLDTYIDLLKTLNDYELFVNFLKAGYDITVFNKQEYKDMPKEWIVKMLTS